MNMCRYGEKHGNKEKERDERGYSKLLYNKE